MKSLKQKIFTIGHSNYQAEQFVKILHSHSIEMLVDVRSEPYSKYCPQFNKNIINQVLSNNKITYLFLGKELGARPKEQSCYVNGKVSFERLKDSEPFKRGILRILELIKQYNTAIMCSEKEPINCHRAILISKVLTHQGVAVKHILSEKELLNHKELEDQLLKKFKIEKTLFDNEFSEDLNLQEAYNEQEKIISYQDSLQDSMI